MAAHPKDTTGSTKDAGWEVGVRKTVAASPTVVWEYLLGDGLGLWLGKTTLPTSKGAAYETADGVRGTLRTLTAGSKIRVSWRPDDWPHDTILQVSVKEAPGGTTIAIQHEQLADRDERRMMLGHWKNVVADLAHAIDR